MIKISIDDGHGYETAGKRTPDGYKENYFNEKVKKFLISELTRNGFSYVDCSPMTTDNSLADRCNRANNANADIFVSIHANAFGAGWNDAEGVETYHYPNSGNGQRLASLVQNELLKGTPQKNRGVKTANFYVLKHTNMPAILVEAAFMTNKKEAELLKTKKFQEETAKDICRGICKYYNKSYKSDEIYSNMPYTKWGYDEGLTTLTTYNKDDKFTVEQIFHILKRFKDKYIK